MSTATATAATALRPVHPQRITHPGRRDRVKPEKVQAGVAAMNDAEVHRLASQLNALAAGGEVSTQNLLLVIILILLLIIIL